MDSWVQGHSLQKPAGMLWKSRCVQIVVGGVSPVWLYRHTSRVYIFVNIPRRHIICVLEDWTKTC